MEKIDKNPSASASAVHPRVSAAVKGQAMAEYVMILAVLTLVSTVALAGFKEALEIYTNRIIARVQDDTK